MNRIPYHRAKEFLEQEIRKYQEQVGAGRLFSELEMEQKGEEIEVEIKVRKNVNHYDILNAVISAMGEMNIRSGGQRGIFYLRSKNYQSEKRGLSVFFHQSLLLDKDYHLAFADKSEFPVGNEVHFGKWGGGFSTQELEAIIQAYKVANAVDGNQQSPRQRLLELGVKLYEARQNTLSWDYLAGYETVKQEIKDTILLPLLHPEIYERMVQETRKQPESPKPKAVLFEGPSGTGKTTMARIIAEGVDCSMAYVPVESIMSKWYGESENLLAEVFDAAAELGNTILFLDEIDALAVSREGEIYEATRRVLSVLLRKIDGFEPNEKTILIGATNRKQDLDAALLSRFDVSIPFPLPNLEERASIFQNYAKQLSAEDLETLARSSEGFSGRNIKDACERAERRWASKLIRDAESLELAGVPSLLEYLSILKSAKKGT